MCFGLTSEDEVTDVSQDHHHHSKPPTLSPDLKLQIKKKLLEKYFSELPESERTRTYILNYVKYMIKNI